ncbi:MAG: hypothetical protein OEV00_07565 [Acidobacteriota bacterium]|nr:hypothetical protein [Acidobacteriota bacterium]MDH3785171.1 hypothetical protein [Acidobacteriota bacterium]
MSRGSTKSAVCQILRAFLAWASASESQHRAAAGWGTPLYDVLRSTDSTDFGTPTCVESDDGIDTVATAQQLQARVDMDLSATIFFRRVAALTGRFSPN